MVGVVTAVGDGAGIDSVGEPIGVGDRVVWAHTACLHCHMCTVEREPTLCPNMHFAYLTSCEQPPYFTGGFAEYGYVLPGAGRLRVPDDVKSTWASAASCALRTVVRAVEAAGPIGFLDSVVVQGAGPVGLFATALLSTHSPRHLIVIGGPAERLAVAGEWGATHTISIDEHPDPADRLELVRSITGTGPTVGFEMAGSRGAVGEGVDMVRPHARYVIVGTVAGGRQEIDVSRVTTRGLRIIGSMSGVIDSYYKAMEFLRGYEDRFDWDRMLGNHYALDELGEAFQSMKRQEEIKPVVVPGR
jgi:threonine dehydrogenase-like Zn-dependent dehydrogenase